MRAVSRFRSPHTSATQLQVIERDEQRQPAHLPERRSGLEDVAPLIGAGAASGVPIPGLSLARRLREPPRRSQPSRRQFRDWRHGWFAFLGRSGCFRVTVSRLRFLLYRISRRVGGVGAPTCRCRCGPCIPGCHVEKELLAVLTAGESEARDVRSGTQAPLRRLNSASRSAPRSSRTLAGALSPALRVQCSTSSMRASISPASTISIGLLVVPTAIIFEAIDCVEGAFSARAFNSSPTFQGISSFRPPTLKWTRSRGSGMRRRANVAARGGPQERVEQAREPVCQFAFPKLQWRAEACAFVEVEYDRPARPDCVELRDDRFESGHSVDLLEQRMPLIPGDFHDLARYVDPHSIKISPIHSGRAYTGLLRAVVVLAALATVNLIRLRTHNHALPKGSRPTRLSSSDSAMPKIDGGNEEQRSTSIPTAVRVDSPLTQAGLQPTSSRAPHHARAGVHCGDQSEPYNRAKAPRVRRATPNTSARGRRDSVPATRASNDA